MTTPTGNQGIGPFSGRAHDEVSDKTDVKEKTEGPGSLEANLDNKASIELDTKLGKISVDVNDQLDAAASTEAAGGEQLDVKDRLKVKAFLRRNELDVFVRDRDRVRATSKGPGELNLNVNDQLGINIEAPPDVNVVLKSRESGKVISQSKDHSAKRPDFLEHAESDKPWDV